jgi:hypothetical protein
MHYYYQAYMYIVRSPVKLNTPGAEGAVPTGIERKPLVI